MSLRSTTMYAGYLLASCAVVTFGLTVFVGTVTERPPVGATSAASMRPPSFSFSTVRPIWPGTVFSPVPLGSTVASRGARSIDERIFAVRSRTDWWE